jgi:hypothetical protein
MLAVSTIGLHFNHKGRGEIMKNLLISAAGALALTLGAAQASAAGSSAELAYAQSLYQQQKWAGAYGRFANLADHGNAEAACIALFMVSHGPSLYKHAWSATQGQIQLWSHSSKCQADTFAAEGGD